MTSLPVGGRVTRGGCFCVGIIASREGTIASREGIIASREGIIASREGIIASREGTIASREVNDPVGGRVTR